MYWNCKKEICCPQNMLGCVPAKKASLLSAAGEDATPSRLASNGSTAFNSELFGSFKMTSDGFSGASNILVPSPLVGIDCDEIKCQKYWHGRS